jgi:hypothetical protein
MMMEFWGWGLGVLNRYEVRSSFASVGLVPHFWVCGKQPERGSRGRLAYDADGNGGAVADAAAFAATADVGDSSPYALSRGSSMASVDLTGAEDAAAGPPESPSSGGSDSPPPGAVDMGVVDELMHALSNSKMALALEREATTPLKQKLRRAQSEAEQLQARLDTLEESANAQRFEVTRRSFCGYEFRQ